MASHVHLHDRIRLNGETLAFTSKWANDEGLAGRHILHNIVVLG